MTSEPGTTASPTTALAEWVSSLKWEQVPEDVKVRANYLLLDGIACGLVAAHVVSNSS